MWRTLFYRIPRLTFLSILLIIAGGAAALLLLGRQEDPTLVDRFGQVVTFYPGADAERVEALVTRPIEEALQELPELSEVDSESRANVSVVHVDVDEALNQTEVDEAFTLLRQKVDQARAQLPPGTSVPDVRRPYVGASTLIVALTWRGEGEPQMAVMNRMARELDERLANMPGTEGTDIYGEGEEEIRVEFDTDALAAAGLTLADAAALIAAADAKTPAGEIRGEGARIGIEVEGSFESISRIRAVPLIQRPDGGTLRVGDVAEVRKAMVEPPVQVAYLNNERTIQVAAFIQTGLRVDTWAAEARRVVEAYSAGTADDVHVEVIFDQAQYTGDRLNGLAQNLGLAALIVMAVLFVFMGWRAAIVVGAALPLTVALVLICFNVFGIPLHQMSVTGLIIALGLLIDNAIVVADEYEQQRQKGIDRVAAIDKSLEHLFGPLFASTLTTALAFAPIALMPGSAGEFIGTMGLSVIFAVTGSFFVAIFIVPALAAWMDAPREKRALMQGRRWWRNGLVIDVVSDGYRWTLDQMLRFKPLGILIGLAPAVLGFMLAGQLPLQFFPQTERDQFQLALEMPQDASIQDTIATTKRATEMLLAYDGIEAVDWTVGEGAPRVYYNVFNQQSNNPRFAAGWVQARDAKVVRAIVKQVQDDMRNAFPEAHFLVLPFEQGPPTNAPIEIEIRGPNLNELNRLGEEARRILADVPGVTFTQATLELGAPSLVLKADEAAAQLAGERLVGVAGQIAAQLEGLPAGSVLEGVEELPVRVIAPQAQRGDLDSVRGILLGRTPGELGTPISALGDITLEPKTGGIVRQSGERANFVRAYLEPFTLPDPAFQTFLKRLDEAGFELPPGYELKTGGEAAERGDAVTNLAATAIPLLIIMAGAVTLVFNSFRVAAIILLTGALSVLMAFIGVWLFGLPNGFNAIVGSLGLFGIAINGAIVVLSALGASREAMAGDRLAQRETIVAATRHIVATTLTTVGGFIPIILAGDMFWLPLATSIAVGVMGSAVLALYFAPALFLLRAGPKYAEKRFGPVATEPEGFAAQPAE